MAEDYNITQKEKLLVLAKTYPTVSRKYEHLVCSAGITEKGELRRIYPVPWNVFWGGGFKKKSWIEYILQDNLPSDHRKESRKIITESIMNLKDADFADIKRILDSKITTIEELNRQSHREVSLGIIRPFEIMDLVAEENPNFDKNVQKKAQQTLTGGSVVKIWIPPKVFSYIFKCCKDCKSHKMMCEDWELLALYRNCNEYFLQGKYKSEDEVLSKVKNRFFTELLKKRYIYFIVGTHFRFNTYMIVGIIYPKKDDKY